MPSINDLKQQQNNSINIDTSNYHDDNNTATSSDYNKQPKSKTIVTAKGMPSRQASSDRIEFDMTSAPKDTTFDEGIHESLAKDILEGENSVFAKYVESKKEEMSEWVAEKEDERELNELEEEVSSNTSANDVLNSISKEEKFSVVDNTNYSEIEDEVFDTDDEEIEEDTNTESALDTLDNEEEVSEEVVANNNIQNIELDEAGSATTNIDIFDEEEETEIASENDEDETIKHLQELATERIKPISQKLDISSFTILKKPTTNTKFLQQQQVKVAKWVIPGQESIVQMKEFLGSELEQLREYSEDPNSITSLTRKFRTIYDHIVSPKPSTYEAWLKSTAYADIDHYFFAIYIACFKGANYIPVDCSNAKCKETYLTEDVPIMDMVKFTDDESKQKFQKIYQNETMFSNKNGLYISEVVPMSNSIAISFKEASVYSLMEIASLDDAFKTKYESILEYIPFIDSLYIIDLQNQSLEPIGYKTYADNATKTIKSKIQKYDSVLKTLSIDEFGPIRAYIRAIRERKVDFSYIFPSVACPKCGTQSEELTASAEEMVFTRYQLGNLVNTSLK